MTTPSEDAPSSDHISPDPERVSGDRRFFGHPLALATLFSVTLWDEFSYYGMQAVLSYYLYRSLAEGGLGMSHVAAASVVGAYGGFVYLTGPAGAWVADRVLGPERTLFYGACLIVAGHVALALLPGIGGVATGLVLVGVGSGGTRTSSIGVTGWLYRPDDPRADAGFALFYLAVNVGAVAGPLVTGVLQEAAGFHWAFGAAAVGMVLGLTVYSRGRRGLPADVGTVTNPLRPGEWVRPVGLVGSAVVVVAVLFAVGVLTAANLSTVLIVVAGVVAVALFTLMLRSPHVDADERSRVRAFIPMFLATAVFLALFQQIFTVLEQYADVRVDRTVLGWQMPLAWTTSIEPFFVIFLAPLFSVLWTKLGERGPSTPTKYALGATGMGLAFLLFLPFADGRPGTTPVAALAGILFVFALAELCVSPIGYSLSARIAPRRFRSQMVALNIIADSIGTALAGSLANFYARGHEAAYFGVTGAVAVVLGVGLFALVPWMRRAMRGVR